MLGIVENVNAPRTARTNLNVFAVCRNATWQHFILSTGLNVQSCLPLSSLGYMLIQRNTTHYEILIYVTCQPLANWENSCCSKNTNCRPRFWHAQFSYFIYTISRRYQAHAGYLSLFLRWHLFFLEHHFYWSKTFECASYESSVATSTTTTASPCYKYKRMTSTPHSLSHSRETALLANFHRGPRPSPELYSSPVRKRSKLFCFTSRIIREIYEQKIKAHSGIIQL